MHEHGWIGMDAVRIVLYHLSLPCASVARQKKEGSKRSPLSNIKLNVKTLMRQRFGVAGTGAGNRIGENQCLIPVG